MENKCIICQKVTERYCSQCKLVYYCSKEHQLQDWKNHRTYCNYIYKNQQECGENEVKILIIPASLNFCRFPRENFNFL
jgi:hypothetical protein